MKRNVELDEYVKEKKKAINRVIAANEKRLNKIKNSVTNSNIIVILKTRIETLNGVLKMLE